MQPPKIIFFNVGWMTNYTGNISSDRTVGNHGYLKNHTHGHECYNFMPYKNKVYAYVPLPHDKNINIQRIGANKLDSYIDDVIVVFIARAPSTSKTVIVGWYTKSTLYRKPQFFPKPSRNINNSQLIYRATANDTDFFCVPEDERTFHIESSRTSPGGFGQSPIWYAEGQDKLIRKVIQYVLQHTSSTKNKQNKHGKSGGWISDTAERRKIEKAAIATTALYYEEAGYSVQSVEKDALGWDLTVSSSTKELFVEVKGTKLNSIIFELTPNEYDKLKTNIHKYKIGVVTDCLSSPILHIFTPTKTHSGKITATSDTGVKISLTEKMGAVGKAT